MNGIVFPSHPKYLLEEIEGGESLNSESLRNNLLLSGIDLSQSERRVVLSKHLGSGGILGSKFFAMSTKKGYK